MKKYKIIMNSGSVYEVETSDKVDFNLIFTQTNFMIINTTIIINTKNISEIIIL